MCEHEWITTRAVYRESVVDGYKNHEINRRVCINCLKTKDEIEFEQQLAAANARIEQAESENKRLHQAIIIFMSTNQSPETYIKAKVALEEK